MLTAEFQNPHASGIGGHTCHQKLPSDSKSLPAECVRLYFIEYFAGSDMTSQLGGSGWLPLLHHACKVKHSVN